MSVRHVERETLGDHRHNIPTFPCNILREVAAVRHHGQAKRRPVGGNEDVDTVIGSALLRRDEDARAGGVALAEVASAVLDAHQSKHSAPQR